MKSYHIICDVLHEFSTSQNDILELSLLNKSTVILIYDTEDILHLLGTFLAQATKLEELFITKGVWSCWRKAYVIISTWDRITIYFIIIVIIIYSDYYIIQYIWFLFVIPWQSLTAFSMASAERMEVSDIFKLLEGKKISLWIYYLYIWTVCEHTHIWSRFKLIQLFKMDRNKSLI